MQMDRMMVSRLFCIATAVAIPAWIFFALPVIPELVNLRSVERQPSSRLVQGMKISQVIGLKDHTGGRVCVAVPIGTYRGQATGSVALSLLADGKVIAETVIPPGTMIDNAYNEICADPGRSESVVFAISGIEKDKSKAPSVWLTKDTSLGASLELDGQTSMQLRIWSYAQPPSVLYFKSRLGAFLLAFACISSAFVAGIAVMQGTRR
ncbi:MAG: hypothetical protein LCH46_11615 [Proteobacteria bacterium]|nr:hypothetical protein [Pseudomonadota bacterium]